MKCQCEVVSISNILLKNFGITISEIHKNLTIFGCVKCWRLFDIYWINSQLKIELIDLKNGIEL